MWFSYVDYVAIENTKTTKDRYKQYRAEGIANISSNISPKISSKAGIKIRKISNNNRTIVVVFAVVLIVV